MGVEIETPISDVVRQGNDAVFEFIQNGGVRTLFVWMALIFVKTHLKDRLLRFHLDRRRGEEFISEVFYDWETLHHVHAVARSFYTECEIQPEAFGSLLGMPVLEDDTREPFDFADLYFAQTLYLRMGGVGFVAVFNDSAGALSVYDRTLQGITGDLSEVQMREVVADLASTNLHIVDRPKFMTMCDKESETCSIVGIRPAELRVHPVNRELRGQILGHTLAQVLNQVNVEGMPPDQVRAAVNAGEITFLFNDEGEFVQHE